jgi:hypothetical protein
MKRARPAQGVEFSTDSRRRALDAAMSQLANHVYTDHADIANFESLVAQLPSDARVLLHLRSGERVQGTVLERPTVQIFEDIQGTQGVNGVVRLDESDGGSYFWLDDIVSVERVGV